MRYIMRRVSKLAHKHTTMKRETDHEQSITNERLRKLETDLSYLADERVRTAEKNLAAVTLRQKHHIGNMTQFDTGTVHFQVYGVLENGACGYHDEQTVFLNFSRQAQNA